MIDCLFFSSTNQTVGAEIQVNFKLKQGSYWSWKSWKVLQFRFGPLYFSQEMWALFDFVCEGTLLGTSRTFKQEYENPIVRVSSCAGIYKLVVNFHCVWAGQYGLEVMKIRIISGRQNLFSDGFLFDARQGKEMPVLMRNVLEWKCQKAFVN